MNNNTAVTKKTKTAQKATDKKVAKPAAKKVEAISAHMGNLNVLSLAADLDHEAKKKASAVVPESAQATEGAPGAGGSKKAAAKAAPKPATTPKKAAKTEKPKADKPMKLRLYAKGEFYFGAKAAARLDGATHVRIEAKGKTVTLTPTKSAKDAHALMTCHAAPVLRVKEVLKGLGFVAFATQDLDVKLVGENGFQFEVR